MFFWSVFMGSLKLSEPVYKFVERPADEKRKKNRKCAAAAGPGRALNTQFLCSTDIIHTNRHQFISLPPGNSPSTIIITFLQSPDSVVIASVDKP